MRNYFKSIAVALLAVVLYATSALATVNTADNGTMAGEAIQINFANGPATTYAGGVSTVDFASLSSGLRMYAADTASTDSYTITLAPVPAAYSAGMLVTFKAVTANTGACTINVNGLGAKALKRGVSTDPGDNFIKAGSIVVAVYDGTNFQMIQPAAQ